MVKANEVVTALCLWLWGIIILVLLTICVYASMKNRKDALERVVGHPVSWYDSWLIGN